MRLTATLTRRFVLHGVLLCLPTLAFCAASTYFLLDKVPLILRERRQAVTEAYKAVAQDLRETPAVATFSGERQKGWRQTSKLGRRGEEQIPWGHVRRGDSELVWIGGESVIGVEVEPMDAVDLAPWLYVGIPLAQALVVLLTVCGVWFFVRFCRERDDFVAATIHDLKNPLLALRDEVGRDVEDERILVESLLRLVGNLREFLRLGSLRCRPTPTEFDAVAACRAAYRLYRAEFRDRLDGADVPLEVVGGKDGRLEVLADESLTVQIFWNLFGNALKYAAPYGPVKVRFVAADGKAKIEFCDQGPGLSPRDRRRIFRRYFRAKSLAASGAGGFGLGLSVSREFALAMGGDLTVRPNAPRGCVFTLVLPRKSVHDKT